MPGRALQRLVLTAAVLGLLAACGGVPVRAPVVGEAGVHHTAPRGYHVVQRGETLYSIAWQYGFNFREVARWNGIRTPYTIYPGQRLRVAPPRRPATARAPAPAASARAAPRRAAGRAAPVHHAATALHWQWPVIGPILRQYNPDSQGKKGIGIGGTPGEPVHAAAAGTVVYSGSGLVGYGRLIIIRHNDEYLSAYGYNRKLLVKENERVRAGQVIAQMGSSGTDRTMLHFEIRREGLPVNPLKYLPKR